MTVEWATTAAPRRQGGDADDTRYSRSYGEGVEAIRLGRICV